MNTPTDDAGADSSQTAAERPATAAEVAPGLRSVDPREELHRIAAFSDAVFAIACTLLVLDIAVPHLNDTMSPGDLWPAMKRQWSSFVAYLISFGSIFVAWTGQHRLLSLLTRSSKPFLYANGLLLLTVTFIPFPMAVLAEYIETPQASIAVMFYTAAQ